MKLYNTDYNAISDEDRKVWEKLKEKEIVYRNGKPTTLRISYYRNYPKSVRRFRSLFPNNFIDAVDLTKAFGQLKAAL